MLYATGRMSINKIAKIFNMCWSLVYRWIKEAAEKCRFRGKAEAQNKPFDVPDHHGRYAGVFGRRGRIRIFCARPPFPQQFHERI